MNHLVSIIIPCFNADRYIGEAVESALKQTYPSVEVIVIDDGSTDRSLEIIKSFGNWIRWETGPNRGGSAARNRGVVLAVGELCQFLDADDTLHPLKLELQVPLALSSERTLVYCDGMYMDSTPSHPHHNRKSNCKDPVVFMLRGGLPTPAPLHSKTWLTKIGGFREDLPCAQERDLHLRIAASGIQFRRLPEVLYAVRRVADSVSADGLRVLDQHLPIAMSVFEDLAKRNLLNEERRQAFAALLARDARYYYRNGRHDSAKKYVAAAHYFHLSGGVPDAYSLGTRMLRCLLGPLLTEKLVLMRRK